MYTKYGNVCRSQQIWSLLKEREKEKKSEKKCEFEDGGEEERVKDEGEKSNGHWNKGEYWVAVAKDGR